MMSSARAGEMNASDLKPGIVVVASLDGTITLTCVGEKTLQVHQRILHPEKLKLLERTAEREPSGEDAARFPLGIEAARFAFADEYRPPTSTCRIACDSNRIQCNPGRLQRFGQPPAVQPSPRLTSVLQMERV